MKTVKDGGVGVSLAKMSFGNQLGAEISLEEDLLLNKNIGSLIIESTSDLKNDLFKLIGEVKADKVLAESGETSPV